MVLWRISRHRDLDGLGGLRAPGRWHERGLPVVYLAETAAGALLDVCVHTAANDVPPSYTLLEVTLPTTTTVEILGVDSLPQDWLENPEATRAIGSEWLRSMRSALLRVPSVLAPATFNVLLNPAHLDAKQIVDPFDPRLKR
ncbi:MAG: RES family NAD+ phosphorylase [Candidatus Korobacteraceae bacterium]